jgi:hypothetical protein
MQPRRGAVLPFTKNDTDGEVSFVGTSTLTNLFFRPVPKVHCAYF